MSAYANDPRVTFPDGKAFILVAVRPGATPDFEVALGMYGGFVISDVDGEYDGLGFSTADEAIASLIGEPQ